MSTLSTENSSTEQKSIILASTSPFRKELLAKLQINFDTAAPNIDESHINGESPEALVKRLAEAKAKVIGDNKPNALVIGSDQVAVCGGEILGKPGDKANAMKQLSNASGKSVTFYTGLCLYNSITQCAQIHCEQFVVKFRQLDEGQISRYLDAEKPYNCAGSFKSEGLGISLFESLHGDDPNSLIGLPLIQLVKMLEQEEVHIP